MKPNQTIISNQVVVQQGCSELISDQVVQRVWRIKRKKKRPTLNPSANVVHWVRELEGTLAHIAA